MSSFYEIKSFKTIKAGSVRSRQTLSLSIKVAQKPYIIGSLGPKALKYESFDAKGINPQPPNPKAQVSEAPKAPSEPPPPPLPGPLQISQPRGQAEERGKLLLKTLNPFPKGPSSPYLWFWYPGSQGFVVV